MLTLAERPQANSIVELLGGEEVRHLKALTAPRDLRSIFVGNALSFPAYY